MSNITYKWNFSTFEVALSEDTLEDVIKTIHWNYIGSDTDGISARTYGVVSLSAANPEDFIPFSEITNDWVVTVVSSKLDVPSLEQYISSQIEEIKNPLTVTKKPPLIG